MNTARALFEEDLKIALKAAAKAYNRKRFVIIGSAAILASHPDAPSYLRLSADIDMFPIRQLDQPAFKPGDDLVGQASAFEVEHEFYIERVGDWTLLTQPEGWMDRCVKFSIDGIDGYCLHPIDLAYNKTEAGREKDIHFVSGLISENILSIEEIETFIKENCPHAELLPQILENFEKVKTKVSD